MEEKIIEWEEGWNHMKSGITKLKKILEGLPEPPFSSEEYIMLYTTIYNMCTQKEPHTEELYIKYMEVLDEYIEASVLPSITYKHDEFMLRELVTRWENYKLMVRWLSRFFHYLDRYFIAKRLLPPLNHSGLSRFWELVYTKVHENAKAAVIILIDKEREGDQIDRSLLKKVVDIFVGTSMGKMDQYENDFEKQMLEATADYYRTKATIWIEAHSCADYMLKAEECLIRERERVSHYLHSNTQMKLVEIVQHELLVIHESQLLEKENSRYYALLRDDRKEDLSRMYKLYHKIPKGLDPVAVLFKQHIMDEGTAFVQQAEETANNQTEKGSGIEEQNLVRKFMDLHDKYMANVDDCFVNQALFHKAVKEAFEVLCKKNVAGSSIAEVLAKFCDNTLKKGGSEKLSDETIEETLEKVVKLLVYVSHKDLFAEFCRRKLAHRLLFDRSANEHHEKSILTKLKQQFGAEFTSNMEGMVTDLTLARDNQTSFQEFLLENNVHPGVDFSVTVLTTGFWPSYKSLNINLPLEMVKCVEDFKFFYGTKTKHRKLNWIYSLGSCNINARFDQKTIELIVSTHQAAVLLLFNNADRLTYSEIMTQLNLTHEDLVRLLHSLSCTKYKILSKEPNKKSISPNDTFEFNSKFTDRMRRIRISLPPSDERKKVIEDVDKDRRYAIDAAVVRIMKSRKVLAHQHLVLECVEQLSRLFKPDIKLIKNWIEVLITRDYLERDQKNLNVFKYIA